MENSQVSERYYIPAIDGDYVEDVGMANWGNHQLGIKVLGSLTTGTLTISAKSVGGESFELVPSGVIDLTDINTPLFKFAASEYNFNLSDITGASTGARVVITDIPVEV